VVHDGVSAQRVPQPFLRDEIDVPPEQCDQLVDHHPEFPQAPAGIIGNGNMDVARWFLSWGEGNRLVNS